MSSPDEHFFFKYFFDVGFVGEISPKKDTAGKNGFMFI